MDDKRCGNCIYFNYGGRRGLDRAECEVYSAMKSNNEKHCTNWKEERHGNYHD